MHNISPAKFHASVSGYGEADSSITPVVDGPWSWRNPVLTVANRDHSDGIRFLFRSDALVVNPWLPEEQRVEIKGQDLYALRELLNEMPEEVFVRPADPALPEEHGFALIDGDGDLWLFNTRVGRWYLVANLTCSEESWFESDVERVMSISEPIIAPERDPRCGFDEGAEAIFEQYGGRVVALPRWADGDVVRNDISGYLYERKNGWWWNRTEGSHNAIPDIDMSNAVDDFPDANIVLRQANA